MGFNLFTWWSGRTFGTWLHTLRRGREVGRDLAGNIYYTDAKSGKRWVIYAIDNDSSRVPPEWHLWLHKTSDLTPDEAGLPVNSWEKPWRPNPTGTAFVEVPSGALVASGKRAPAAADYRPWSPGR